MPKYTQPRKTWQYTKIFKIKAVKLSLHDGILVKQVTDGLDIHPFMLSRWRKEYREGKLQGDNRKRVGVNKKKHDDEACGEVETEHPSYLGSHVGKARCAMAERRWILCLRVIQFGLSHYRLGAHPAPPIADVR